MSESKHVAGLDTIRFICATWVLFGHFGVMPLPAIIDRAPQVARVARVFIGNLFCGPAAVIVFFLVSGFCIHYPYRQGRRPPLKAFYARRYVRILIPMAVAIGLGIPLELGLTHLNDSILWSLLCEEIYYLLYPLVLLRLRHRMGFRPMIAVTFVLALGVALTNPGAGNYASYGAGLNWLIGLPCWLLGCELADTASSIPAPSSARIWTYRLGIWGLSAVLSVLRFHSPLRYPWTLNWFALAAFFWLGAEIAYQERNGSVPALERAGKWSYALYLTHVHGHYLFLALAARLLTLGLPTLTPALHWLFAMTFTYVFAYAFYRVVEKPAHDLARRIAQRILERTPIPVTAE
jgi:peptidoglycan/LPS O-acetylase OafA/YrhL